MWDGVDFHIFVPTETDWKRIIPDNRNFLRDVENPYLTKIIGFEIQNTFNHKARVNIKLNRDFP